MIIGKPKNTESPVYLPDTESRIVSGKKRLVPELPKSEIDILKAYVPASRPREGVRSRELISAKVTKIVNGIRSKEALRHTGDPNLRTWEILLSGENAAVSSRGFPKILPGSALKLAGAKYVDRMIYNKTVETGADIARLRSQDPTSHYKFYHSFSDIDLGRQYAAEVIRRASEAGISLRMKTFDHDYDGLNFYTHHYQELSDIIKEVYPTYRAAFGSTEHFLQGSVDDSVDASHIGWAQEPISGYSDSSHSERMGMIGAVIDKDGLSEGAYLQGCLIAGVRPDMPWMLSSEYEAQLIARRNTPTIETLATSKG